MAEPLINQYGADVPRAIAAMVQPVHPAFDSAGFVREVLIGYEALALMARGKKIARALRQFLPPDYAQALAILLASTQQPHGRDPGLTLGTFCTCRTRCLWRSMVWTTLSCRCRHSTR